MTLYSLNISQAPCSTPLRSTEEVEEFVSPSPLSFMRALGGMLPVHSLWGRFSQNHSQSTPFLKISLLQRSPNVLKRRIQECTKPTEKLQSSHKSRPGIPLQDTSATLSLGFVSALRCPLSIHRPPMLGLSHPSIVGT